MEIGREVMAKGYIVITDLLYSRHFLQKIE